MVFLFFFIFGEWVGCCKDSAPRMPYTFKPRWVDTFNINNNSGIFLNGQISQPCFFAWKKNTRYVHNIKPNGFHFSSQNIRFHLDTSKWCQFYFITLLNMAQHLFSCCARVIAYLSFTRRGKFMFTILFLFIYLYFINNYSFGLFE